MQAANGSSQGVASEPITFTLPQPMVASTSIKPEPVKATEPVLVLDDVVPPSKRRGRDV